MTDPIDTAVDTASVADAQHSGTVGSRIRVIQGVHFGVFWGHFWLSPTRARAYNDSAKIPILLKTASNGVLDTPIMCRFRAHFDPPKWAESATCGIKGGIRGVRIGPKWGPFGHI